MATPDITVRGAGIFGLSVAWACQSRGAHVQVIDPGGPGAGASGGIVGALAPHVPERWNPKKAFQLESLLTAEGFWAEVKVVSGLSPGYARTGRLQPLKDAAALDLARQRASSAAEIWGPHATWSVIEADPDAAWGPRTETGHLVHDTLTARIHPRRACESLAAAIAARGGEVLRDGEEAGTVIHATGTAGLKTLSESLGKPLGDGVKGQALLLRHAAPEGAPQIFADGLHIVPHADGTVAIGSTTERDFTHETPEIGATDALLDRAVAVLPILHGAAILSRWAGLRPRAITRAPLLGPWPGRPGQFIANGGFKIGFGMAPGVAEVMADLVLDGRDRIPEGFRIDDALARASR
ncbi:NAD(P)/FAD-dependent oxidoreductase [Ovoidimarina sediminis]|uniref:NAD(P)/FAD-dependent oxidoreductase n=1 Tax=Ovoidimarina sediminis TaxID=3079856 RepID=UPI00290ADB97|nr:FAD-dependent oxidoreductase [Rhodophyticola sp. MJ-SS7]MDU8943979.1 FAD-dependent oxidoreductase [Rhodophyticola sp. MJ-SS7]